MNHPEKIIIHCSDVSSRKSSNQLDSINQYHKTRGFPLSRLGYYVGYHVLITGGKLYHTRLETEEGAHTVGENLRSLGICVGFDGDVEYPTPEDYILLQRQVWRWQEMYAIPDDKVFYHRAFNTSKSCPGSLLGVEWKANLLRRTPVAKPIDQDEKQKEILIQKISILQKLINLYLQLRK
jgi:N-acetylmuramoyl-L-alanine amidase